MALRAPDDVRRAGGRGQSAPAGYAAGQAVEDSPPGTREAALKNIARGTPGVRLLAVTMLV